MTERRKSSTTSSERPPGGARALVEVTPAQTRILLEAAHLWLARGAWDKAEEVFDGLCCLLPGFELAWLGRGLLAQAQGRTADALRFFRRSQSLAPRSGLVRLHVAEALLLLGHRGEAEREYRTVERCAPGLPMAEVASARLAQLR